MTPARRNSFTTTRTDSEAGVDAFAKDGKSLCVFFQGHPEYAADTLMRDVISAGRRHSILSFPVQAQPDTPTRTRDPS